MNHSTRTAKLKVSEGAFTLLELIIGIALIGIVLTGVYKIASASIMLSDKVLTRQHDDMHMHSFMSVMKRNIEDIPGNAKINMEPPQGLGGVVRSEIVFEDYPLAFSWAGVAVGSKMICIVSGPDNALQGATKIEIRYLNREEAEIYVENGSLSEDMGMSIVLMSGLKSVTWNFFDQRDKEWKEDWGREDHPNDRPSMVYMEIAFLDDSEPIRSYYWVPTVEDPAAVARATQSGNSRGNGRTSGSRGNDSRDRRGDSADGRGGRGRGDKGRSDDGRKGSGGRGPVRPPTSTGGKRPTGSSGLPGGPSRGK